MKIRIIFFLAFLAPAAHAITCGEIEKMSAEIAFHAQHIHEATGRRDVAQTLYEERERHLGSIQVTINRINSDIAFENAQSDEIKKIIENKRTLDEALSTDRAAKKDIATAIESELTSKVDAPRIDVIIQTVNGRKMNEHSRLSAVALLENFQEIQKTDFSRATNYLKAALDELKRPASKYIMDASHLLEKQLNDLKSTWDGKVTDDKKALIPVQNEFHHVDAEAAGYKTTIDANQNEINDRAPKLDAVVRKLGNQRCANPSPGRTRMENFSR